MNNTDLTAPLGDPEPDPNARASSAADFKRWRTEGQLMVLPTSGLTVRCQRVHIASLAAAGKIPDHLSGAVLSALNIRDDEDREPPKTVKAAVEKTVELVNAMCSAVLMEPRMVPDPRGEDAISPDDMHYADREHIYQWACGLVEATLPMRFPDRPTADVAPVADGAGLQPPAE